MLTLAISPPMRATLWAVSTLFKSTVDKVPLPIECIPELSGPPSPYKHEKRKKNERKTFWHSIGTEKNNNYYKWSNAWLILVDSFS